MDEIVIYHIHGNRGQVEVQLGDQTVWLSQQQMATLFKQTKQNISLHINNLYHEKELTKKSTVKDSLIVQKEGQREVSRQISFYNLDVIISVGYRVKSKQGTLFRIWATKVLNEHLVKGYTLNEKKLRESQERYEELKSTLALITRAAANKKLAKKEGEGILKILKDYSHALNLLDEYDHQKLKIPRGKRGKINELTYDTAIVQIHQWRVTQNADSLFGNEKDKSFKSSLNTIYQTFEGQDLYPSLEEKAANLLYFIVKNHSFTDGNKRIGAGIFVYFLDLNNAMLRKDGTKILADNALVALTLLIAESKPEEKDTIVKLIVNLLR